MPKPIHNTPCHCLRIRRSAENVIAFYDNTLAPAGVTVRQYSILHSISTHSGCSIRELGEIMVLDRSTLARNLKPLITQGLVVDLKEPGARNSKLSLSEEGKATKRQAAKLWLQAQEKYEQFLGAQKLNELEDALFLLQSLS